MIANAFIETHEIEPTFTLYVWDTSFPDRLPDVDWANTYIELNQPIPFAITTPYKILFDRGQGLIFVYDTTEKIGAVWMRDHSAIDQRVCVSPFRIMLSWMANEFDGEIIHASGIEIQGKGVLISGPSGSGKSSLAIFGALGGDKILADDAILVEQNMAYAIYARSKISPNNSVLDITNLKTFELQNSPDGKRILPLDTLGRNSITEMKLDFFIFPIIVQMTHIEQISIDIAGSLLLKHSLRELFGGDASNLRRHKQILNSTSNFRMALSGNMPKDYKCLQNLVLKTND